MPAKLPIRVFQVATGNVGSEMIRRITNHPDLELVGLHCYTPEKIGRDAGEIVGLPPIGVTATGSVDEIIAAKPDVLTFHGVFPDEDLYVAVLEAGINVVTTADWITGWHRDRNHPHHSGKPVTQLLQEACEKGGSTFYGTGMNPGVNQIVGVVCSADVAEIENITTIESVDVSCHHSKDTWIEVGYGLPVDDPSIPTRLEKYTRVFADSVLMMADCFDIDLDEVTFSYELGACTKDVDLGWYLLPKGSLGGSYIKYQGMVDGVPRIETHLEWQMTPHTDPQLGHQGLLHHPDQGRPVHLQQAHDLPEARRRSVQPGVVRLHRDDRHRHAGAQRDRLGGGGPAGPAHKRRPAAARVRGSIQEINFGCSDQHARASERTETPTVSLRIRFGEQKMNTQFKVTFRPDLGNQHAAGRTPSQQQFAPFHGLLFAAGMPDRR